MGRFDQKVVLITGANGEIPRAVATVMAEAGAHLVLSDLVTDGLVEFAATLAGAPPLVLKHDITDPGASVRVASEIRARHGRLDVLVNGAGIYRHLPLDGIAEHDWHRSIGVNLDGVFWICQATHSLFPQGGAIVNIASVAGHRGSPAHAPYAAAKGGVLALSRSLAQELAPRIRVNAVSPGLIDTRMMAALDADRKAGMMAQTPLGRLGTPGEVAAVVAFLSSDDAAYVTGETIHVNGGLYIAS
jgi:3-oxoacyl-[acyl-carrier protein] reductase